MAPRRSAVTQLRGARRRRRKRYGTYELRGRVAGKRAITSRPAVVARRTQIGHWEADTVLGTGRPCVLSMVERKTGYVLLGKLEAPTTAAVNRRATPPNATACARSQPTTAPNSTATPRSQPASTTDCANG